MTERRELSCDVLVIGGGTAGTMAAISAAEQGASVLLLEKAHVRHSGALAMGMDGVNNAVIPGKATPEDYVAEITRANDGIVNQRTIMQTATRGYDMVRRLEGYGVKFEKDSYGEYAVRRVHRSGSYVLPMPEGKDVKKVLYRVLRERRMRALVTITNRVMPVRVLTSDGRAVGAVGFDTRSGDFVTVSAKAVVLATGPCGRLGLPASGYLYGTYENPTNAGDGYSMAYHAGAELSGIECFQINPLIKDYNGPACAYVANPFGGYQANAAGDRFVDCDYWSGQMMAEVAREIHSERGPIYLRLSHLPEESVRALEGILHTTERPTRGTFHSGRGHDYRTHDVEMHISEIGLCGGHSASGVWVDEHGQTTVPGLYAAGDLACVPHNYMIGAFVFGDLAGTRAASREVPLVPLPEDQISAAHELIYRPLSNPDGPPQPQVEYKLRRLVNDYVAPPKSSNRLEIAIEHFSRMRTEIAAMGARTPHELMRCAEVTFIRDCAEMAARSSLVRTESRWGLYHDRLDHPTRDDDSWFAHLNLRKGPDGAMEFLRRPVSPYLVPVPEFPVPVGGPATLIARHLPASLTLNSASPKASRSAAASSDLVALLALADASPSLADLRPYLASPIEEVRVTAVTTLTETTPSGFALALAEAFDDPAPTVRHAAAAGLRELVEVVEAAEQLAPRLLRATHNAEPAVRATALYLLRSLRLGSQPTFADALTDTEPEVRIEAVHGLVSRSASTPLASAAADSSREVRIAVAQGLGSIADDPAKAALMPLATDPDPLVRAAALASGSDSLTDLATTALLDEAWQVREAATAVAATNQLLSAVADPHPNVRRAAVRALGQLPASAEALTVLTEALADPDADVRAYARHALR
ncbi:fumarate reductase/succinate dehydrogenase flavoprotein subunit [Kutzneria sp. CA-103260]|uniref:fumarate reductase/succinate dehydrogenase flavoprotein subunit n=1 Tax=Kutzneria sp. CA-103260 TaxID=2802641 RepID=UPI001BA4F693|nr:fumarate reductase/succinate dehydrogenase flavoprotein subunit [Kutzneria sp. CA-103260]QUQ70729.1 fumarate reductase/succinate dehydrogenase flavoprotein subunit [Kutzneria sp. CA-103260]